MDEITYRQPPLSALGTGGTYPIILSPSVPKYGQFFARLQVHSVLSVHSYRQKYYCPISPFSPLLYYVFVHSTPFSHYCRLYDAPPTEPTQNTPFCAATRPLRPPLPHPHSHALPPLCHLPAQTLRNLLPFRTWRDVRGLRRHHPLAAEKTIQMVNK